jgi:hypothetical protein
VDWVELIKLSLKNLYGKVVDKAATKRLGISLGIASI